jgi:hypothetical protein
MIVEWKCERILRNFEMGVFGMKFGVGLFGMNAGEKR